MKFQIELTTFKKNNPASFWFNPNFNRIGTGWIFAMWFLKRAGITILYQK